MSKRDTESLNAAEEQGAFDMYEADIDFSEIEESAGPQVLPADTYNATVSDVEKRVGPKGPYYNWSFKIMDEPYSGVPVYMITSLSEKSADITFKTMQTILGEKLPRGRFSMAANRDRFLGRTVRLKIKPEPYQDAMQNRVERVLPLAGADNGSHSVASANKLF